ncbi:hypothetical protein Tco_0955536 [Tanacetum coccineum]|uniref:Uncharacterized protein n=1 Tax=Tanacetum coccineum TaxID=301880 RepID=A0ABQ5E7J6_9ASTR
MKEMVKAKMHDIGKFFANEPSVNVKEQVKDVSLDYPTLSDNTLGGGSKLRTERERESRGTWCSPCNALGRKETDIQEKEQKESQKQAIPSTGRKGPSQVEVEVVRLMKEFVLVDTYENGIQIDFSLRSLIPKNLHVSLTTPHHSKQNLVEFLWERYSLLGPQCDYGLSIRWREIAGSLSLLRNSYPRPPEARKPILIAIESSLIYIPVADNDSLMEEIELFSCCADQSTGTDISQKDEKPIKKRQNRTRDGKVCGDEAKSKQLLSFTKALRWLRLFPIEAKRIQRLDLLLDLPSILHLCFASSKEGRATNEGLSAINRLITRRTKPSTASSPAPAPVKAVEPIGCVTLAVVPISPKLYQPHMATLSGQHV